MGGSRKVSKQKKRKRNWVGGDEKIKFQKERTEIREKKLGRGRGENKVAKKKLRSGLRKGKQKKST